MTTSRENRLKTPHLCHAALLAGLTCLAPQALADAGTGGLSAKALFFGTDNQVRAVPTAPPQSTVPMAAASAPARVATAQPKPVERRVARAAPPGMLGASYFVRLKREDGSTRDVLTSHDFRTGERFQIGLKVNRPMYIYIYNQEPGGKVVQLYPQPGQTNRVDAMGVMFFPNQGSFQFSGRPGTEEVSVLMSSKPLERPENAATTAQVDLVSAPASDAAAGRCVDGSNTVAAEPAPAPAPAATPAPRAEATMLAAADTGRLNHKAITFQPAAAACAPQPRLASKAISFVDDASPAPGGQPASYVVKADSKPAAALHLRLKLSHR